MKNKNMNTNGKGNGNGNGKCKWLSVYLLDAQEQDWWSNDDFASHVIIHFSDEWKMHEAMCNVTDCANPGGGNFNVPAWKVKASAGSMKNAAMKMYFMRGLQRKAGHYADNFVNAVKQLAERGKLFYRWKVVEI